MTIPYVPGNGLNAFPTTLPPTVKAGSTRIGGSGNPEGVISAEPGIGYVDSVTNDLYVKIAGVQQLGWRKAGKAGSGGGCTSTSSVLSGNGSPVGVITPAAISAFYIQKDSTPPGIIWAWYDSAWH